MCQIVMKKIFVVSSLLVVFLACKKDSNLSKEFIGKWEYERYSGYPFTNTFLPPGNGQIIVLYDNGIYERRMHDTVLFKGNYSISKKDDCHPRENKVYFTNNDSYSSSGYIEIANEKLTLSSSNCLLDGGTTFYRKLE